MKWRLRQASAADADALSLIASATFLTTYATILDGADLVSHCVSHNQPERMAAWAKAGGAVLAELAGGHAPVGYTVLTEPDLPITPHLGDIELRRIYALPMMHGLGLGRAMIARALEDAAADGKHRMLLGVYGKNYRAHAFYEGQGFEVVGTRQFVVGNTTHDDFVYGRAI